MALSFDDRITIRHYQMTDEELERLYDESEGA